MKLCHNCNAQLEDNAVFCSSCGVAQPQVEPTASPQYQQPSQQPVYNGAVNMPVMPALYNDSPIMAAVRKIVSSPMYIAMAVAFCVSLALSFISSIAGLGGITSALSDFYQNNPYGTSDLTDLYGELSSSATGSVSVISILTAVAMWMIFAAARDRYRKMNTSGLKILKVIAIIDLVAICVITGLVALVFFLVIVVVPVSGEESLSEFAYNYSQYGYDNDSSVAVSSAAIVAALIFLFVILTAVFAFLIVYQAFVVKVINSAKKTLETDTPDLKGYGFVAVMMIIKGILNILFSGSLAFILSPVAGFSNIVSGVATLLAGLLLLRFKKEMERFIVPTYMQYYQPSGGYVPAPQQYGAQPEMAYQPEQNTVQPPVEAPVAEQPTAEPAPVAEQPTVESNDELK